jgi:hypothetical protein
MDEHPGKVIDGTARARHWRRSQPGSTEESHVASEHSEAPKSIASSLLVPPALLDGESAPQRGEEHANGDAPAGSLSANGIDGDVPDRNIFLAEDAAVAASPRRRSARISKVGAGLVRAMAAARRTISDVHVRRPEFSVSVRPRVAKVLGLAGACALAAILIVALPTTSTPQSRSIGHASAAIEFGRLKETLLSSTEGAFGAALANARPDSSVTRTSTRPSVPRVHDARRESTRGARALAARGVESLSAATANKASSRVASDSSSSTPSAPVNDSLAQQSPTQHIAQQQQVHYQPPSQPAGPTGLGSQVGGSCNPKCS